MREYTAPVDISDQGHRAIHGLGKTHVGNVVLAQVDLSGTARPFDNHIVILLRQAGVGLQYRLHRRSLVIMKGACIELAQRATLDNDLRTRITGGFEQHGVHIGMWGDASGLGLQRLGAADLTAIRGHRAVERHILRLEGGYPVTAASEHPAEPGDKNTLACIGGRTLHHQCVRGVTAALLHNVSSRLEPAPVLMQRETGKEAAMTLGNPA